MPIYKVQAPDGSVMEIEAPEGASDQAILQFAAQTYKTPPPPVRDTGFTGAAKSSIEQIQADAYKTAGKLGILPIKEAEEKSAQLERRAKQIFQPTEKGWTEAPGEKFRELLGGSLPYVAAPVAAAGVGMVAVPSAPVLAPALAALAAGTAQYTGSNLARQMEADKKGLQETNLGYAVAGAVPQALLDTYSLGMTPLIRRMFASAGISLAESQAVDIAKRGLMSTLKDYGGVTAKTATREGLTEAAQQSLERLQAGLNITDAEARKEYFDSFIGGAVLGGTLGPVGRYLEGPARPTNQGIRPLTDQTNPLTDPVGIGEESPIVGTTTVDSDGKQSQKVTRRDGSVEIDGVQVVPPTQGGATPETFKQSAVDLGLAQGQQFYQQETLPIGGAIDTSSPLGRELSSTQAEVEALGKQNATLLAPEAATVQPTVAPQESAALALRLTDGLKQNPALRTQFEAAKLEFDAQGRTDLSQVFQTVLDTVPAPKATKAAPVIAPEVQQKVQEVRKTLIPALKQYGLEGTGLQIMDSLGNGTADGYYAQNLVTVALDSDNHLGTLRHETVHALKNLNAFTPQEWQVLTNKAKSDWIPQFITPDTQERYRQQYAQDNNGDMAGFDEYLQEEGIAEAFKHFNNKLPAGMVGNLMYRLKQFFQSLKNTFSGQGFNTSDSIFRGIEATKYKPQAATQARGKFDVRSSASITPKEGGFDPNGYEPMAYKGNVSANGRRYSLLQHASVYDFDKINQARLNAFGFGYGAYASVNKDLNAKIIGKKDITETSQRYAQNYVTGKAGYIYLSDFPLTKENAIFPYESPDSQPAIVNKFIEAGIIRPEKINDYYRTTQEYGDKLVFQMGDALTAMRNAYAEDMLISGYPMTGFIGEKKPSGVEFNDNFGIQKRIADELDRMGIEATVHPYGDDTHAVIHNPQKFNASLVGKYELERNGDIKKISGRDLKALGLFAKVKGIFSKKKAEKFTVKPEDLPSASERRYSFVRKAKEGEKEISTQNATGPKAKFNPLEDVYSIDEKSVLEAMENRPEIKQRTIAAIKEYGFIPKDTADDQVIPLFKKNIVNNLLFLYNSVPAEIRNRSKLWYDGANKIAKQMGKEYGLTDMQVSGILAAMSPQKDWFQNVSMAERAIDILSKRGDMAWDENMLKYAQSYVKETKDRKEREKRELGYKNIEKVAKAGTKLKDMDIESAAGFVRAYDEAYQSRTYRIVTPEGGFSGLVMNNPDKKTKEIKPSTMMWSTYDPIEKSVSIYRDGNRDNISQQLGFEHKIRSFYNNIVAPNSDISHVTIDTHAVAAGMFEALAGTDTEVLHNFGGTGKAKNLGVGGTYGLIADAYRDAAKQVGMKAREMQSITWEAVRGLFNEDIKATIKAPIRGEWTKYRNGEQTFEQARDKIIKIAGGMNDPQWVGSDAGKTIAEGASSYDKSYEPEGGVRLRQENVIREKITVNLSNVTSSIQGLNELHQRSMDGDEKAYAVLQDVAKAHLEHLLSGTSAKVKIEPVMGAYGSVREPAINASLAFPEADRKEVMAAVARFATNFNQEQVHVRQATAYPIGHDFGDGSYVTPVFTMGINRQLTNEELANIIEETGIPAITISSKEKDGATQWSATTYFRDPFENTEKAYEEYIQQVKSLDKTLARVVGRSDKTVKPTAQRLYVYGDGDGARLGYQSIAGDVRPKEANDTRSSNLVANYFKGEPVTGFKQKSLNKAEIAAQKSLVEIFEALPNNDLKRPIVRRAYTALARELVEQYKILPIKVEVVTDVMMDGESYNYFSEKGVKEFKQALSRGMVEADADSAIKYLQDHYGVPDPAWQKKGGLLARIEADNKDIYPKELGSKAMRDDVNQNNRLKVYKTSPDTFGPAGSSFKSHPLLKPSGLKDSNGYPMLYNDLLRAVHDYYSHNLTPAEFGAKGEFAAARNHLAVTKDPMAKWALIAETRLQNAWQNFRKGVESIPLIDRPYAIQKAALPPIEYALSGDPFTDVAVRKMMETMTPEEKLGSLPPSAPIAKKYKFSLRQPASTVKYTITGKVSASSYPASRIKAPDTPAFKQWFGKSKIVDAKGNPLVLYHGTARDITEFKPKQANAIFLTADPTFAEDFGDASEAYMIKELFNGATPQERNKYIMDGANVARKNGDISSKEFAEIKSDFSQMDVTFGLIPSAIEQEVTYVLKNQLPTRQNIIPMFARAENPFDFGNKEQVDVLNTELNKPEYNRFLKEGDEKYGDKNRGFIERGHWSTIESEKVQNALKKLGHDGFFVLEGGRKNLAVYNPSQVKSAIGNIGTFDINNPDIRFSLREPAKIGINVNQDGENRYADKIVDGEKTYETRESDSLKRFWVSGDRVAIVRTGEGTAKAIGEATIGKPVIVTTQKEFDKYRSQTLIPKGSKFDIKEGGVKYLYPIINPERYESEFDVEFGHVSRKVVAPNIRFALNAPPKQLTAQTPVYTAGQQVQQAASAAHQVFTTDPNEFWTKLRINWVDPNAGLTKRLQNLPIFDSKGQLRADMLNRARAQSINLIKNGLTGGVPVLNTDGSIIIKDDPVNNLANSQLLADGLNNNQYVKDSGLDGRGYVAEVARALRGEEIMQEDAAHNAVNPPVKHLNREKQVDAAQIAWAKQQMQNVPELKDIFSIWKNVNTSLVDLWEQVGLLDAKAANEYRGKKSYVSLAASIADMEERMGEGFGHAYTGTKGVKKIQRLEGSDLFRNIWENVSKQYASMLAGAYQNQTRKVAVEQLSGLGLAKITNPTDPDINLRYKDQNHPQANKEGIVSVVVDNPNDVAAFESMHYQLSPIMKAMSGATGVLRAGALLNPMFWIRQLVRDPIQAALTNSPLVTPLHSAKEYINILRRDSAEARLLAERGVIGPVDSTLDLQDFLETAGQKFADRNKTSAMLNKLMEMHEASDAATRVAIYKKAKQEALARGLNNVDATNEAVYKARESINFAVRGNSPTLAALRHMTPFLSAAISSLDVLYKAATGYGLPPKERAEARAMFKRRALMMGAMSIAYAMMMQDDEEYQKVPDYIRDNNWLIHNPFGEGFIKIPTPFEVGFLMKTIPEGMVRYIYGNSTGKQVVKSYLNGLANSLPGDAVPLPQLIKPAVEAITNYSLFTYSPIESIGESKLPVEMRGRRASETAKALSKAGLGELGLSPAKIDHLIQGYFAEWGTFSTFLIDKAVTESKGETPMDKNLAQQPFFKSFITDPTRDKVVGDFYELYRTANQVSAAVKDYQTTGAYDAIKEIYADEDKVKLLRAAPALNRIADNMGKINKQIRLIQNSQNIPPDERLERVNVLEAQLARVARQHLQLSKALEIQ
jgi:predicted transcriptional regulator